MPAPADPLGDLSLAAFLDRLASAEPVPGGGSASAVAAALAASLTVMVARLSLGRPKYAAHSGTHERAIRNGDAARARFLELADADAVAYAAYADALKLPRDTPDEHSARADAVRSTARRAAEVPMEVVRACRRTIEDVESLAGRSNLNASSDLNVAALLTVAAARGAAENVLVNLPATEDTKLTGAFSAQIDDHLYWIEHLAHQVRERVAQRSLRDPEEVETSGASVVTENASSDRPESTIA